MHERAAELDEAIPDIDWTVPPDGAVKGWFEAPSGRLATLSMGNPDDQWVVMVPGVTGSKEDFVLMLPLLAQAGYYAFSFDMAGQYESHAAGPQNLRPPEARYGHHLFVGDLVAVLEAASGPSHVLGYSFAGTIAQLVYADHPQHFSSLTLLSTPPTPGQAYLTMRKHGWASRVSTAGMGARIMITGVKNNYSKVPPGRLKFIRDRLELTRFDSVRDIIRLMKHTPDLRPELAYASIPKLVAVGEHDLWPLETHARFAEAIGARIAVYRTGHSPCETTPHQLVGDMLDLFGRSETAA